MEPYKKLDIDELGERLNEIKDLRVKFEELRKDMDVIKKTLE